MSAFIGIVVAGGISSFLVSTTIGANDVANALGTSVGSKAITLKQAVVMGGICEFLGALLLGSHVSSTIRSGILYGEEFTSAEIGPFMLGMLCVLIASFTWLAVATYFSLPVSTTHSTVAGIIGFALIQKGATVVKWEKLGLIVASWFISPVLGGVVAGFFFWTLRKWILRYKEVWWLHPDPVTQTLKLLQYYAALTVTILYLFMVLKGIKVDMELWVILVSAVGVFFVIAMTTRFVVVRQLQVQRLAAHQKAEQFRAFVGKYKKRRKDRKRRKKTREEVDAQLDGDIGKIDNESDIDASGTALQLDDEISVDYTESEADTQSEVPSVSTDVWGPSLDVQEEEENKLDLDKGLTRRVMSQIKKVEVVADEEAPPELGPNGEVAMEDVELGRMDDGTLGEAAPEPEPEPEPEPKTKEEIKRERIVASAESHFVFLMVLTAIAVSFAHGANDVANSIGPMAAVWSAYETNSLQAQTPIPIWMLLVGGGGIVIGLLAFGYRVMKTIGEKITKLTFTRGYAAQLGAAVTVLLASVLGIPVSTTHTLVGAVAGIGLLDDKDKLNKKVLYSIAGSWLVTIPAGGGIALLLFLALRAIIFPVAS